jgi:hypothetical protein
MRAPALLATAGLTLIAMSAAACSGASGTAAAPASPAAAAAGSSAAGTAGSAPPAGSATKFNVCGALPAAAAAQITGTAFTTAKSSGVGAISSCEYDGPGGALLQISVETQGGKVGYDAIVSSLKTVRHPPASVSGVGDEAFSEPNPEGNAGSVGASAFASFGALFGDTFIQIGGLTYVTAAQGTKIAEELHGKL